MNIHTIFSANQVTESDIKNKIAVIIDVFRATSVIVTAINNGCKAVTAVSTIEEAVRLASISDEEILLTGERQGEIINGFNLGNSPLEFSKEVVCNKHIIMTTTNGTKAIDNCKSADELYILSFLNLESVADLLVKKDKDIVIVCAGNKGFFSIEDGMCGGALISLIQSQKNVVLDDSGTAISMLYTGSSDVNKTLTLGTHYKALENLNQSKDLAFCMQKNIYNIVPCFNNGKIIRAF